MPSDPLASVFQELDVARKLVKKSGNRQIRNQEDRDTLNATAFAWFSHRKQILSSADPMLLQAVDTPYNAILAATGKNSAQSTYLDAMTSAKDALIALRGQLAIAHGTTSMDAPPSFVPLVGDPTMRGILERRWHECQKCIGAGADLAAIVMMGGLLEALFVARANTMSSATKPSLFKCKATPRDSKTQKPTNLRDWTLGPYIDVGYELNWITRSGKDVAAVLRDYRNYVHPEKERTHGIVMTADDSAMLWGVTKSLVLQILASAQQP